MSDQPQLELECDGCFKTITVPKSLWDEDLGRGLPRCTCKGFRGWMIVGGKAWNDYHLKGKHPMDQVTKRVKEAFEKYTKSN